MCSSLILMLHNQEKFLVFIMYHEIKVIKKFSSRSRKYIYVLGYLLVIKKTFDGQYKKLKDE